LPEGRELVGHEYRLYPPHYDSRRHGPYYDPEYGYTSVEMRELAQHLVKLRKDVQGYQNLLFGERA
jgi:hypothetical protein